MRTLVTGGNRGIGAALLTEGEARGHEVIGTARSGGDWVLDVTDANMQRDVAARIGRLDLLVCNAGVFLDKGKALADLTAQDWADTFAANVAGVAMTVQAQRRNLSAGGRIAIIASIMGSSERAGGNGFVYRAAKAAAINLGRNLAEDLRSDGIAVGIYHPGWVRTDMGGAGADLGVEASARGLWDRFEALSLERTGVFESFDGTPLPF